MSLGSLTQQGISGKPGVALAAEACIAVHGTLLALRHQIRKDLSYGAPHHSFPRTMRWDRHVPSARIGVPCGTSANEDMQTVTPRATLQEGEDTPGGARAARARARAEGA